MTTSIAPANAATDATNAYVDALNARFPKFTFAVAAAGAKYDKVAHVVEYGSSVHAFVERATGNVYKPAGWKAPAKGVRANVGTPEALAALIDSLADNDWAGGYLYLRR